MTVCRRGFQNGTMAYMLQVGKSNLQRIFLALVVFVEAIFSRLSLKPDN